MSYTEEQIKNILDRHKMWIRNEQGGERADLSRADLSGADLSRANLSRANLSRADLSRADLSGADLSGADLSRANLSRAYLSRADLSRAYLFRAYLSGADLSGANLYGAKNVPFIPYACPDFGAFIGYKKAGCFIIQLEILSDARRLSATGRKCRCDKAKVLNITNIDGSECEIKEVQSNYDINFIYKVGEIVKVDDFCEDRWQECSAGIHFFINRKEAVDYEI